MRRSLAVNVGTLSVPVLDRGTELEPPPHDTPPPDKGAEFPDHPPKQTLALTRVSGPSWLESLRARHHGM